MSNYLNIRNKKLVIWDCETEGLNLFYSKPWEISWAVYENYKELESHQYFLKWPGLKVSPSAARVTNFNPFVVERDGKEPSEIIDLFSEYLYNPEYLSIGANILGYDSMIINSARQQLGYKSDFSFISRCYDTVALAKAYKQNLKLKEGEDFIAWQYKLLNTRVKGLKTSNSVMYKELTGKEIDTNSLHSGKYDVKLTTEVFYELIKRLNY